MDFVPPLHVPEEGFLIETLKKVYTEKTGQPAKAGHRRRHLCTAIKNAVAFGPAFPGRPEWLTRRMNTSPSMT